MRRRIVIAVTGLGLLTLACAGGQKEGKRPAGESEGQVIQCPYCKAVFKF